MKPARLLPTWPIRIEHTYDSILSFFIFLVRLRSFVIKPGRESLRSRCRTSWWSTRESKCRASSMRANRRSTSAGKRTASSSCPVSHLVLLGRGRRAGVSDWSIQRRSTPNLLFWPSTSYIIVLVGQLLALSSKSGPSKFLFFYLNWKKVTVNHGGNYSCRETSLERPSIPLCYEPTWWPSSLLFACSYALFVGIGFLIQEPSRPNQE